VVGRRRVEGRHYAEEEDRAHKRGLVCPAMCLAACHEVNKRNKVARR
jgi:hypothetical protein